MSSKICQGLDSCLETQAFEPGPTGPKLAPHNSHFSQPLIQDHVTPHISDPDSDSDSEEHEKSSANNSDKTNTSNNHPNGDFGGWSFLETTLTKETKVEEKETHYVYPLAAKRSLSTLSNKSLELCTENLGCETGSDIGENNDICYYSSSDSENGMSPTTERSKVGQFLHKKVSRQSFPPPLISSSDGIHFRPHREGGRLVIKAVTIVPSQACFQVERGDGRLRLRFTKNYDFPNFEIEDDVDEDEEEEEEYEEDAQEERQGYLNEEIEGNHSNAEGEMVNGNYQRSCSCRCKDGGHDKKGLLHWEPFLGVAATT